MLSPHGKQVWSEQSGPVGPGSPLAPSSVVAGASEAPISLGASESSAPFAGVFALPPQALAKSHAPSAMTAAGRRGKNDSKTLGSFQERIRLGSLALQANRECGRRLAPAGAWVTSE